MSAHELADDGRRLEAGLALRGLLESAFTVGWMAKDPDLTFLIWMLDDLENNLSQHREVQRHARTERKRMTRAGLSPAPLTKGQSLGLLHPSTVRRYERDAAELKQRLASLPARTKRLRKLKQVRRRRSGGQTLTTDMPSFRKRAQVAGLKHLYALIYRFDSRAIAHPNPLAVEQFLERTDYGIVIRSTPSRPLPDPYAAGAGLFGLILEKASEAMPEFALDGELDRLVEELAALRPFESSS